MTFIITSTNIESSYARKTSFSLFKSIFDYNMCRMDCNIVSSPSRKLFHLLFNNTTLNASFGPTMHLHLIEVLSGFLRLLIYSPKNKKPNYYSSSVTFKNESETPRYLSIIQIPSVSLFFTHPFKNGSRENASL
jgi:hypothetical protein